MSNNQNQPQRSSGENSDCEANPRRSISFAAGCNGRKDVHASFAPFPPPQSTSTSATGGSSQSPSTDPSAIVLISPRVFQSQNQIDGGLSSSVHLSTIFYEVDDSQSIISLRISRGKSQVNLQDPSRSYRRVPGDTCSAIVMMTAQGGDVEPENQIFPSPVLDKPFGIVKAEYDFYTPGQTMENVKDKVHQAKTRLSEMKDCLVKVRETACILTAIAESFRKSSDEAAKSSFGNDNKPTSHWNSLVEDSTSSKTDTTGLSDDRSNSLSSDENTSEDDGSIPDSSQKVSNEEPANDSAPNEPNVP